MRSAAHDMGIDEGWWADELMVVWRLVYFLMQQKIEETSKGIEIWLIIKLPSKWFSIFWYDSVRNKKIISNPTSGMVFFRFRNNQRISIPNEQTTWFQFLPLRLSS